MSTDVTSKLQQLSLSELRPVGYLLEEFVDHEVRGVSIEGIASEIAAGVAELDQEQLEVFVGRLTREFGTSLGLEADTVKESTGSADVVEESEPDEINDPLLETVAYRRRTSTFQKWDRSRLAAEDREASDVEFIQVRCHPDDPDIWNGDLIWRPTKHVTKRYPHAIISKARALELGAEGYQWNMLVPFTASPEVEEFVAMLHDEQTDVAA